MVEQSPSSQLGQVACLIKEQLDPKICQNLLNGIVLLYTMKNLELMQFNNSSRSIIYFFQSLVNWNYVFRSLFSADVKPLCSSSVYVEGDIETRVYNDNINGEVKNIPEICIRRDGTSPS